jgi:hypothetical protein
LHIVTAADRVVFTVDSATQFKDGLLSAADKLKLDSGVGTGGGGAVAMVFGRTGTVVALLGDYSADKVTTFPSGGLTSGNVQAALEELDLEKAGIAHTHGLGDMAWIGDAPASGEVLTWDATTVKAVWSASIGGGGGGGAGSEIDGGRADSVYLPSETVDGGTALGT